MSCWMVRAGERAYLAEDFYDKGCVALYGEELGDLSGIAGKEALTERIDSVWAAWKPGKRRVWCGMLARFLFELQEGALVLTYERTRRVYYVGKLTSGYQYKPGQIEGYPHTRKVEWGWEVGRDDLSVAARNSLGAIQTLFRISDEVTAELRALCTTGGPIERPQGAADATGDGELDADALRQSLIEQSQEFIKDQVSRLDWEALQDLVAGVLRAMGYKTRVSAKGPDRGRDIVASPDGLGLEQPRIVVEVKHRPKTYMSAPDIRSFIGGLRTSDKGLYVSTGGFSKEAKYEADRSTIPVTLIDLDELVELLLQGYDALDSETRALVPLKKIYWPA